MRSPTIIELRLAVEQGLVRVQSHPEFPLLVWNYTEECAWSESWNETTLQCRGLITDLKGNVVARPFLKFFNYGEPLCPITDLSHVHGYVEITDKLDGSLGIIYPHSEYGFAVATRGSFTSEQALHATALLRAKYGYWAPPDDVTVLVEIIYPDNRIVINYDFDDLVYICAINNENGADYADVLVNWPGPWRADYAISMNVLKTEIATPTLGDNREGFVLCWPRATEPAVRVKMKYSEYVALHKVVTGLSTKTVWEALRDNKFDDLIAVLPQPWDEYALNYSRDLTMEYCRVRAEADAGYDAVLALPTRKEQALAILDDPFLQPYSSLIFALLDGRNIGQAIWRRIEPPYRPLTKI
jgi:RNA ligase